MYFNDGAFQTCQRITNAVAVVRPITCIDHDGIYSCYEALVNTLTHLRFAVGLKAINNDAQLFA